MAGTDSKGSGRCLASAANRGTAKDLQQRKRDIAGKSQSHARPLGRSLFQDSLHSERPPPLFKAVGETAGQDSSHLLPTGAAADLGASPDSSAAFRIWADSPLEADLGVP